MTSFVYNEKSPVPNGPRTIDLTITEGPNKTLAWAYSHKHIILNGSVAEILIQLINKTQALAAIATYASSGVTEAQQPIKSDSFCRRGDGQAASFSISLLPNQLVNFGVFVSLLWPDGSETMLFCDPQASNDPIKTP